MEEILALGFLLPCGAWDVARTREFPCLSETCSSARPYGSFSLSSLKDDAFALNVWMRVRKWYNTWHEEDSHVREKQTYGFQT
jgi:hypothetical protein